MAANTTSYALPAPAAGFKIVVALSLLGKYLDQRWQTGPWLLIIGFVLSLLISVLIIYRKAKRYGQEYQKLS